MRMGEREIKEGSDLDKKKRRFKWYFEMIREGGRKGSVDREGERGFTENGKWEVGERPVVNKRGFTGSW